MNARMTLVGMEQTLNANEKSINDTWALLPSDEPIDEYDKDVLLAEIIRKGGTFEPLYTDPDYFLWDCGMWWKKWRRTFTKWWKAFQIQYAPLENYDRHEIAHSDTLDVGALAQATHAQEVMDDDTTHQHTSTEVMDDDTTSNRTLERNWSEEADGTTSSKEVIDDKNTHNATTTEVVDDETSGSKKINTSDNLTTTKNITSTEVVDGENAKNVTHSETENKQNNGNYTTNLSVAGFNSVSLEPKSGESNSHADTDTRTTNGTSAETGTNDVTTTHNQAESGAENRDVETSETTNSTEDRTTTTTETESGTDDRTTTTSGTTHEEKSGHNTDTEAQSGTDDRTTTITGQESGTDDRTIINDGTLNQNTQNDRDWDHTSYIHGNIGVTTSQQMLESELKVQAWNIYEHMSDLFVREMCVCVY